jgi:PAS domain S-box-containing protein
MRGKENGDGDLPEERNRQLQACFGDIRPVMLRNRDGILVVDARRTIRFANPAAAAMFGCTGEELTTKEFEFPLESDKTIELEVKSRSGETVIVEMWAAETKWDSDSAWFVSLRDITGRKLAEETLQRSEEKFARLFRYAPSLMIVSSTLKEGRLIEVNEAFEKAFDYRRDEVIGRSAIDLGIWLDPEDRARVIQKIREEGGVRDQVFKFRNRHGKVFVGLYSATLIRIGGEACLLSMANDITERKRMEEEIEELNTTLANRAFELEAANRELEAFNYTVSHDLRRPLTNINGYCQVVLEKCSENLGGECRRYFREIYDGTLQMNRLIDTLLNFSRLTRVKLSRETVDLSGMAQAVAAELQMAEPNRSAKFRISKGISVDGDPHLLRVVLENLLGNAWKYTGKREEAIIEFGRVELGGKPACFVRDNGVGFDMAHAAELFNPFQRLPGTDEFQGHGIGLATVERIIQRHGGRVWAEGRKGEGATFFFTVA